MKTKKYVLLAVAIAILTTSIAAGADPYGVEEARDKVDKLIDRNFHIGLIGDVIGFLIFIFIIYLAVKWWEQEKKKQLNAVRDIVHTEVQKPIETTPKRESCENCGRTIGKIEKSYVFEEHIVCGECHQRLKNQE